MKVNDIPSHRHPAKVGIHLWSMPPTEYRQRTTCHFQSWLSGCMGHWYENNPRQTIRRGNPCGCPPPFRAHFHPSVCDGKVAWRIPLKTTPGNPSVGAIRESLLPFSSLVVPVAAGIRDCSENSPRLTRRRGNPLWLPVLVPPSTLSSLMPRAGPCWVSVTGDAATRKYVHPEPVEGSNDSPFVCQTYPGNP